MKKLITLIAIIVSVCVNCNGQSIYLNGRSDEFNNPNNHHFIYIKMMVEYDMKKADSLSKLYPIYIHTEPYYALIGELTPDQLYSTGRLEEVKIDCDFCYSLYLPIDSTESYYKYPLTYSWGKWVSPNLHVPKHTLLVYGTKQQCKDLRDKDICYMKMLGEKLNIDLRFEP